MIQNTFWELALLTTSGKATTKLHLFQSSSTLPICRVNTGRHKKTGTFEMRSGSHVQLAALRNRDTELQTTSPFSNHGSVERSTACFRHKNVSVLLGFQKFPFFCVTLYNIHDTQNVGSLPAFRSPVTATVTLVLIFRTLPIVVGTYNTHDFRKYVLHPLSGDLQWRVSIRTVWTILLDTAARLWWVLMWLTQCFGSPFHSRFQAIWRQGTRFTLS